MKVDTARIEALVRQIIVEIGEDPQREGLVKTPHRVAAAYEFLTSGYRTDAQRLINDWALERDRFWQVAPKEMVDKLEHPLSDKTQRKSAE